MGNFKATSTSTVEARLFVYGNQVASGSATASSSSTGDIISEVRERASELSTTLAQNLASGTVPSISSATIEFKTDTSTTVTNSIYSNIVGIWYGTIAKTNSTNAWALNSGVKSDGTVVTPTPNGPAAQSITTTWSSIPGTSASSGTCPIPPYNVGQSPFNAVFFFPSTNDVTDAINSVTKNTSSGGSYNCFQDAINYFNTNSTYYNNPSYGNVPNSQLLVLTLGAGNTTPTGYWTQSVIANIIDNINNGTLNTSNTYYYDSTTGLSYGFGGLCFDIETGDSGLETAFTGGPNSWTYNGVSYPGLFYAASNAGYGVFTTISHSAPYGFSDTGAIMEAIFKCPYINQYILQFYTQSVGTINEYASTNGISFEQDALWIQQNPNWNSGNNNLLSASIYIYNGFTYQKTFYNGLFFGPGTNATGTTNNFEPLMSYNDSETTSNCSNVDTTSPGFGYPFPYPPPANEFPTNTDLGVANFLNNVFSTTVTSGVQWSNGNFINNIY
jgi:hypothetical protein